MKEGEISAPAEVQVTEDLKAARIIFFKRKISPHRANMRDDYEKLKQAATQLKMARTRQEYLMEKMQEVYLEVDPEFNRCGIINN